MSTKYKFYDQEQLYFVSYSVVYWIDLFVRDVYKNILLDSWKYCMKEKGMELYGWVIMTNHVHMILGSHGDKLENIMRDMKRHTSIELKKAIFENEGESRRDWMINLMTEAGKANSQNKNFQLWQQTNHPILLQTLEMAHQKLDYTHNNPVVAGFVSKAEDWLFSSARDYEGTKGLIDITFLESLVI